VIPAKSIDDEPSRASSQACGGFIAREEKETYLAPRSLETANAKSKTISALKPVLVLKQILKADPLPPQLPLS
jgi:hypothetical protein